MEPGLSEITNMTVDSSRASGTPAVVYDNRELLRTLNQGAQYKAENDWRQYNLFLNNLKDVYKDVNEIAKQPVMPGDKEALKNQAGEIFQQISKDPKSFFGGGKSYQDVLGKIVDLQTKTTQSKQDHAYDVAHRSYFYRNPDLDTPDNKSLIDGFVGQKLGERKPYMLSLPGLFDPAMMGESINQIIKQDYQTEAASPDNQFLDKTTGTKYDHAKFQEVSLAFLDAPDKRGVPLRKTLEQRFNALPDYVKDQYKQSQDPIKDYYLDIMNPLRKQDVSKTDRAANPNYLKAEALAEDKRAAKARESNDRGRLGLDWEKFNYAKEEDRFGASAVLNEAKDIIDKGVEVKIEGPGAKTVLRIGDPTLLKNFGNIDKDGNVTNVPDAIDYDRDKDQVKLVYYDDKKSPGGKNVVSKEVSLDQRTWLKEIAKRSFPNKDIGKINTLVDDILTKNGNSLYKISQGGSSTEININDVPTGAILTDKNGKPSKTGTYYNGKKVVM